jgi:lactaldehyde dehydrogenase/glycolaldehyde dehydrogenase
MIREISAGIRAHKGLLARVISEEQGKILPLAEIEVEFSADHVTERFTREKSSLIAS